MAKVNNKQRYKFVMSRYVIEIEVNESWVYETQIQKFSVAKAIVDKLINGTGNKLRAYNNVTGNVVYPKSEVDLWESQKVN